MTDVLTLKKCGGEEGIRTLGSFESPVFKTGSLNRSDTSPFQGRLLSYHFFEPLSTEKWQVPHKKSKIFQKVQRMINQDVRTGFAQLCLAAESPHGTRGNHPRIMSRENIHV